MDRTEVWICLRPQADAEADAAAIDAKVAAGGRLPLAGTVFSVKGNIDVAGLATSAGCPRTRTSRTPTPQWWPA